LLIPLDPKETRSSVKKKRYIKSELTLLIDKMSISQIQLKILMAYMRNQMLYKKKSTKLLELY